MGARVTADIPECRPAASVPLLLDPRHATAAARDRTRGREHRPDSGTWRASGRPAEAHAGHPTRVPLQSEPQLHAPPVRTSRLHPWLLARTSAWEHANCWNNRTWCDEMNAPATPVAWHAGTDRHHNRRLLDRGKQLRTLEMEPVMVLASTSAASPPPTRTVSRLRARRLAASPGRLARAPRTGLGHAASATASAAMSAGRLLPSCACTTPDRP